MKETAKLIAAVDKKGFKQLILTNQLLNYLVDKEIFEPMGETDERKN